MTATTRRAVLATAVSAPALGLPTAQAAQPEPGAPDLYAAIRERVREAGRAFSRPTAAFPEPMPEAELDAALALTDAEIAEGGLLPFAHRWGLSLDWLLAGDVAGLLHHTRCALGAPEDCPALAANSEWEAAWSAECLAEDDETAERTGDAAHAALVRLCTAKPATVAGVAAQLRAWRTFHGRGCLPCGETFTDILDGAERLAALRA